ncbi:hypothetical protein MRB53_029824 [Persea americana]|uniref:Uncharacterized protein n=1 Tax=Persea americana TaxID=3435 RepID=A0ACC2KJX0_PERAE|nr:hypothetical protein MRB53_029824 [Persea americana]
MAAATVLHWRTPIPHILALISPNPNPKPNPSGSGRRRRSLQQHRISPALLFGSDSRSFSRSRAEIVERVEIHCGRRNLLSVLCGN